MRICGLFVNNKDELLSSWLLNEKKEFIRAAIKKGLKRPLNPKYYPDCHVREVEKVQDDSHDLTELEAIDVFEEIVNESSLVLVNPKELENEIKEE